MVTVKPQSKSPPPPPPPVESPKEEKVEEPAAAAAGDADTPLPLTPAPEPQGAEVRSAVILSLPPGKTLVDTLAEQAADVTVWGFRLTDRDATTPPKATVPEGFGSVGTDDVGGESAKVVGGEVNVDTQRQLPEGVREAKVVPKEGEGTSLDEEVLVVVEEGAAVIGEKFDKVEEKVLEIVEEAVAAVVEKVTEVEEVLESVEEGVAVVVEKVTEVEEKAASAVVEVLSPVLGKEEAEQVVEGVEKVVGEAVQEGVEAAAGVVEKHVAPVVEEAAKQVEEIADQVGRVAEVVEEAGEKVEEALGVAERVTGEVEEAAKAFPVIPEAEVERVEKVVEETQAVVESITTTAKEVEGVAEEVKKEAQKVEEEATEVMESKEKRKEVADELVEFLETKEQHHPEGVEEQADVSPPLLKETTPQAQTEVDTSPAEPLTLKAEHTQEREGLFDKLVSLFSEPSKDVIDSAKEVEAAAEVTGVAKSASEDLTVPVATSGVPETTTLVEDKAQSGTEADTQTLQLQEGIPKEGEGVSLGEEVLVVVEEGAAAVGEKVEEVLEIVVEKVTEVEAVLGKEEAEQVVEGVEKVVGEAVQEGVETAAGVVEEHVKREREGLFDKLMSLFEPSKDVIDSVKEEQSSNEFIISSSVGQEAEILDMFKPSETIDLKENTPVETEGVTPVLSEAIKTTDDQINKPQTEITEKLESETTEKSETETVKQLETESITHSFVMVEGEEEVQSPGSEDQIPQVSAREGGPKRDASESVEAEVPREREGLFNQLVRLLTKDDDDKSPVSSSATVPPRESAAAGVPLPGEGQESVGEEETHIGAPGEIISQVDVVSGEPADTTQLGEEVPPKPSVGEALGGELAGTTPPQEADPTGDTVSSSSEGVRVSADTLDTKEGKTEGTPLQPLTPPLVKKKGLFDKLSSLFQEEEQHKTQEPTMKVEEDKGDSVAAGVEAAESATPAEGKEEEAASAVPVKTTAAQVQFSSVVGADLMHQPCVEVSGEAPESVEETVPSMSKGAKGQDESREPGTVPHVVEVESVSPPVIESVKDTAVPTLGEVAPAGSPALDGRVSITSEGDTFIVRASPNRPSEVEAQGEDRGAGGKVVRPSWSRVKSEPLSQSVNCCSGSQPLMALAWGVLSSVAACPL